MFRITFNKKYIEQKNIQDIDIYLIENINDIIDKNSILNTKNKRLKERQRYLLVEHSKNNLIVLTKETFETIKEDLEKKSLYNIFEGNIVREMDINMLISPTKFIRTSKLISLFNKQ